MNSVTVTVIHTVIHRNMKVACTGSRIARMSCD